MAADVVIVGAGQAGFQVAASLVQGGYPGRITLLGAEPYPPYERPPLSKAFLLGDLVEDRLFFRARSFYAEKGIMLRTGVRVTDIDRARHRLRLTDGTSLAYDRLVLATGARPRHLDIPGSTLAGIHYLRDLEDSRTLGAALAGGSRLVIIGAGYIGLEVAAAARARGAGVVVVETRERVLERTASAPVAAALAARHTRAGVSFRFGAQVTAFHGRDGHVSAVGLADTTSLETDAVLVGIGAMPETTLAAAAGLATPDGIPVDARGRTADPDIFAAGDCALYAHPLATGALRIESVQNAVDQAKAVAAALLDRDAPYEAVPWFWSDQYERKLQIAGLVHPDDEIVLRGDPAADGFSVAHLRAGRLVALEALDRPRDYVQARKLIAAGARPDPAHLADPAIALKDLA